MSCPNCDALLPATTMRCPVCYTGELSGAARVVPPGPGRRQLRAILDNAPVEIALKDLEGRYVMVNRRVDQLYAGASTTYLGRTPEEIHGTESARTLHEMDLTVARSGRKQETEVRDAQGRTFLATSFPVRTRRGNAIGVGTIGLEISERRNAEDALKRLNDELETRVADRTRELRETQVALVEQERLAALAQLMSSISHELRNPLSVLRTCLALLDGGEVHPDPRIESILDRMRRSVERSDRVLDEMLAFARESPPRTRPTKLDLWLNALLRREVAPQGVHIEFDGGAGDAVVALDPDALARAIAAVLRNAYQAIEEAPPDGMAKIHVRTAPEERGVAIVIEDPGAGMSPQVLERAFEPMFSTRGFGMGLGLTRARRILEGHGGGMRLDSEPGHGSRATLRLPFLDGTPSDPPA